MISKEPSALPAQTRPASSVWRVILLLGAFAAIALPLSAQTLAHSRWSGSGLSDDPWWRTAVFYEIDPLAFSASKPGESKGDLAGIAQRLDYLQSLNVDAILLSPLKTVAAAPGAPPALDPIYGAPTDFDDLVQQASGRKIRILVDLPLSSRPTADLTSLARFWFSRGVAGLRLTGDPTDASRSAPPMTPFELDTAERQLHQIAAGFVGQRIILTDPGLIPPATPDQTSSTTTPTPDPATQSSPHGRGTSGSFTQPASGGGLAQLILVPLLEKLDGPALHTALQAAQSSPASHPAPVFLTNTDAHPRTPVRYGDPGHTNAISRLIATLLFTSRSATLLDYGQEIGFDQPGLMPWGIQPPAPAPGTRTPKPAPAPNPSEVAAQDPDPKSLLGWYRALSALHHNNSALNSGTSTLIETGSPDIVAWVRKPAVGVPVVILLNLAPHPNVASLTATFRSGFLRTLIPSMVTGSFVQPAKVASIPLPAYGVFIGEVAR